MSVSDVFENNDLSDYDPQSDLIDLDDIATSAMQGMLAAHPDVDAAAAASQAWLVCVPAYINARARFFQTMAPMLGLTIVKPIAGD